MFPTPWKDTARCCQTCRRSASSLVRFFARHSKHALHQGGKATPPLGWLHCLLPMLRQTVRRPALVDGVLNAHQAGPCEMTVRRIDFSPDDRRWHSPMGFIYKPDTCPTVARYAATFIVVNVAQAVTQHLISWRNVHVDGDLVGHGARRTKQPCFMPKSGGQLLLEAVDRRVFGINVITCGRRHHGLQHGFRRPGDRVTPQINHKFCNEAKSVELEAN